MSDQTQQSQLLDPDSAYAHVHQRVYAPVFFEKLASDYGVRPTNEQEAMQMLQMAAQLREAHEQQTKQASAQGNSLLSMAQQHLNNALGEAGYDVSGPTEVGIEKLAGAIAMEPDVAHAVLSLQASAALAQQQQSQN